MSSQSEQRSSYERGGRLQAELDVALRRAYDTARLLVGLTTHGDPGERNRLVESVSRGEHAKPRWRWRPIEVDRAVWQALERARHIAAAAGLSDLYLPRLEELETELLLLESLGRAKHVRPMAARLFGTGGERLFGDGSATALQAARQILADAEVHEEPKTVPAVCDREINLRDLMLVYAKRVGLHVAVQVDPRLVANAAVGERTVFIADRCFGFREAHRLATHEVYGHLVSAFNGRAQRLGVLAVGTAGAHGDQEGVAILLEELAGLLCSGRKRTLAGRVVATHAMHAGVAFGDAARMLIKEHAFSPLESVTLCERAFRAGGVARDAVYLGGWLRVRRAIARKEATLAELQLGKISLAAVPAVRRLAGDGRVSNPTYLSNFARSRGRTDAGTRSDTSPPSFATSLTSVEAT